MSSHNNAVIFANGQIENLLSVSNLILPDDLIIAADGGARHCQKLGMTPAVLIGDFDSLEQANLVELERAGVQVIRHPQRKDYTDLELALLHAKSIGVTHIKVFGALGLRWDQTLANMLLPASGELEDIEISIIDGDQELTVIHSGEPHLIIGNPGDTVSLIPLSGDTAGIRTEGLEYPLNDESLTFGATRGISNIMLDRQATVQVAQGMLLCVVIHLP